MMRVLALSLATLTAVVAWNISVFFAIFVKAQTNSGDQSVLSDEENAYIDAHTARLTEGRGHRAVRFDPATGDGIVILSTGSEMLATELAGEWVFWKTGNIDSLMFLIRFEAMLIWMAAGSLLIVIFVCIFGRRSRQSKQSDPASN